MAPGEFEDGNCTRSWEASGCIRRWKMNTKKMGADCPQSVSRMRHECCRRCFEDGCRWFCGLSSEFLEDVVSVLSRMAADGSAQNPQKLPTLKPWCGVCRITWHFQQVDCDGQVRVLHASLQMPTCTSNTNHKEWVWRCMHATGLLAELQPVASNFPTNNSCQLVTIDSSPGNL